MGNYFLLIGVIRRRGIFSKLFYGEGGGGGGGGEAKEGKSWM
jgi:hypothetical protein